MQFSDVLYRFMLCIYGFVVYSIVASNMAAYPHAHCRAGPSGQP